jgi:hypothetical protein
MLLALAVRVLAAMQIPALTYDGVFYLRQASRLLQGSYRFESFPPGLPLLVALFGPTGADLEFVARCINLVAGVASVGLAYSLARRHLGPTASFVFALLLAIHPVFVRVQVEVWSEPLYLLGILAAFELYERRRFTLCGACLGYAFLLRPESLLLLAGLAIAYTWQHRRPPWGLLLAGLLPVAAFSFLASRELGSFVITPKQGQWDLSAAMWKRLLTTVKTLHMVFPLLLVPIALYEGLRRRSILLLPALYLAALPLYNIHIQPRLHLPAVVFLGILALAWVTRQPARLRHSTVVVCLVLLAWGVSATAVSFFKPNVMVEHSREVGESFRPYVGFDDIIASRFPFIPWYAGAGFLRMELLPYEALMDSIQAQGATHLLVLENEVVNVRPQLRPLFEDEPYAQTESRLQLIHREERYPYARALLYELRQPPIPEGLPAAAPEVVSVAWLEKEWIAVDRHGGFLAMQTGTAASQLQATVQAASLTQLYEVAVSPQASQVAFLQSGGHLWIFNRETTAWNEFQVAIDQKPYQLTWIDENTLLYLRGFGAAGIQALDTQSGVVFPVELAGVPTATSTPVAIAARTGAGNIIDLAITYRRSMRDKPLERAIATTRWPAVLPDPAGSLLLQVRWGTFIQLYDEKLSWIPGRDQLVVSQSILQSASEDKVEHSGSLCIVQEGGQTRRLSFHYPDVSTPVFRQDINSDAPHCDLLFLGGIPTAGSSQTRRQGLPSLRHIELPREALRIPQVSLFRDPQLRP